MSTDALADCIASSLFLDNFCHFILQKVKDAVEPLVQPVTEVSNEVRSYFSV